MVRHLHSLRRMQRDHGWIHTLLEEAENEVCGLYLLHQSLPWRFHSPHPPTHLSPPTFTAHAPAHVLAPEAAGPAL